MRGKRLFCEPFEAEAGITPAYAGKTFILSADNIIFVGSPPRMRGKPDSVQGTVKAARITPAYAGKTVI